MMITQRLRGGAAAVYGATLTAGTRAAPAGRSARATLRTVSGTGWAVLCAAIGCWIAGAVLDWVELTTLAAVGLVLVVLCVAFTLGRARLQVEVGIDPVRVTVGDPAAGQVRIVNRARGPLLPIRLELPIGADVARFELPVLRPGGEDEELFVVPTSRRGVVPIGPAMTVRGDPLGFVRREVSWTDVTELFVHPVTVPLDPLGTGLLRDLEGRTTNDVSMSDLAFHALRDFQPGDDRRYIHWRSSAKAGRFLVRQFLDTRRSHVACVVDGDAASYAHPDEFELALAAAASIAVRGVLDEQEVTVSAAAHVGTSEQGRRILDVFARAQFCDAGLGQLAARTARNAANATVCLLITGSRTPYAEVRRAAANFPSETRLFGLRVDPASATTVREVGTFTMLSLRTLNELPPLLAGTLS